MSWISLTPIEVIETQRAAVFRTLHVAARRWFRKVCTHCGNAWGRDGCALYVWATDVLSSKSRLVVGDRPARPKRRHTARFIAKLDDAKRELNRMRCGVAAVPMRRWQSEQPRRRPRPLAF